MTKVCSRCKSEKDRATEFYFSKGYPKGECKTCTKDLATTRQKTRGRYPPKEGVRKRQYQNQKAKHENGRSEASFNARFRRHGLTLDQYHAMAERQNFLCPICGDEPAPQNNRKGNMDNFVIDHDHEHPQKRVRGLTCWQCNSGLGHLRDNPVIARNAMDYLTHHHSFR